MPEAISALETRLAELREWLAADPHECTESQQHLDAGSVARSYWHYGYAVALSDALALLRED